MVVAKIFLVPAGAPPGRTSAWYRHKSTLPFACSKVKISCTSILFVAAKATFAGAIPESVSVPLLFINI